jgi:hypothetical protein
MLVLPTYPLSVIVLADELTELQSGLIASGVVTSAEASDAADFDMNTAWPNRRLTATAILAPLKGLIQQRFMSG